MRAPEPAVLPADCAVVIGNPDTRQLFLGTETGRETHFAEFVRKRNGVTAEGAWILYSPVATYLRGVAGRLRAAGVRVSGPGATLADLRDQCQRCKVVVLVAHSMTRRFKDDDVFDTRSVRAFLESTAPDVAGGDEASLAVALNSIEGRGWPRGRVEESLGSAVRHSPAIELADGGHSFAVMLSTIGTHVAVADLAVCQSASIADALASCARHLYVISNRNAVSADIRLAVVVAAFSDLSRTGPERYSTCLGRVLGYVADPNGKERK